MFQRLLAWFGQVFQTFLGLLLPLFSSSGAALLSKPVFFILQFLLVAVILVCLWLVNDYFELHKHIQIWPRQLAHVWLPILFLILFAMVWLSYLLWKELTTEEVASEFPDIDQAWSEAVAALRRARIELQDFPIFLVLGQPEGDDDLLFQTAALTMKVRRAPGSDEPIRVYACTEPKKEAIFVTCPDTSVLSRRAAWLTRPRDSTNAVPSSIREREAGGEEADTRSLTPEMAATMHPEEKDVHALEIQRVLLQAERGGGNTPVHQRELRLIERRRRGTALEGAKIERQRKRLEHLCRLIRRDLAPRCPINAVLALIPFAGTDTDQDARDVADACRIDLETTRDALGMHCPVYAVVCDMESAPGFIEFIAHFKAKERLSRIGQRFPFCPGLTSTGPERGRTDTSSLKGLLRSLAVWICTGFMRRWIYEKCQVEKQDADDLAKVLGDNSRLFELLCELQQRQKQLGTILGDGFSGYAPVHRLLFGGCYLAATGESAEHRAFLADVIHRMLDEDKKSILYWTEKTRADEDRLDRWVTMGWSAIIGLVAITLGIVGYWRFFA